MLATNIVQCLLRSTVSIPLIAAVSGLLLSLGTSSFNQAHAQGAGVSGPVFSEIAEPGQVFIDLGALPPEPPGPAVAVPEGSPDEGVGFVGVPTGVPDPLLQQGFEGFTLFDVLDSHGALSTPVQNFPGLNGFAPPDTVGDVWLNHYIQMVNATQFQIWNKQGVTLAGPTSLRTLWTTAAAGNAAFQPECQAPDIGDPIVVYDPLADRWLLAQFANPNHMCIAISQTGNPVANTWNLYDFNTIEFPDYEKFGVWPDGYYMTSNESNQGIYVFDRANMLTGNPATFVKFTEPTGGACPRSSRLLPSDLDGAPPPAGSPNFILRAQEACQSGAGDRLQIWEFHADWQAGGTPTFGSLQTIDAGSSPALADFTLMPCDIGGGGVRACIRQPDGGTNPVDALTGRPMMQLKYRNFPTYESIVTNMTVDAGGNNNAGIRWWELRRTPAGSGSWVIHQQGTYAPNQAGATDTTWVSRWMGSAAMDRDGNIALGYSITNGDQANPIFPGISYTGRLATDPLGLLPQGEESIIAGAGVQPAANGQRWGDYSALSVDPADDCTFWYTQEYINANGNVQTQIASFAFNTCGTDLAVVKSASPSPATAGGLLTYTITVTNNGPPDATNVTVVDTLPAGTTYQADTDSCVQSPLGTLTCSLGTITAGSTQSFTVQVLIGSGVVGSITNTASVSADQADVDPSNDTASVTTIVNALADLSLTKQCKPDGAAPTGGTATCTIFVDNLGSSDALNVVVTDSHLSNGSFTITSATFDPPPGSLCSIANGVVTCNLGTEPAGGRTTITVQLTSNEQVDVNDTATVQSNTPDPNTVNNTATGKVSFSGTADLSLSKTDSPDPVVAGTNLTYTLTATNNGPSTAPNVVVKDVLPAEVTLVSATPSQGSCSGTTVPGDPLQPLTCNLGTLANGGGTANVTVVVKVKQNVPNGTILVNNADVTSAYSDPNNGNNNVTTTTTVNTSADLAIAKTSDKATYKPSSLITYTVTVVNNGASDARAVVVKDTLPVTKQAIYLSDTGGCTKSGLILTCNFGYMAVGDSRSFNINITVKGSKGNVTNTATVTSSDSDPVAGNNTAVRVVTIQGGG